jgi:hypothetical protein
MTRLALSGPPMPHRGEERFFDRRQADDACAWALAGGVAIHGDLDGHDGGRPLRVLSQLPVLLDWGSRHGLPAGRVRSARRGCPPHFHVHGRLALQLAGRAQTAGSNGRGQGGA